MRWRTCLPALSLLAMAAHAHADPPRPLPYGLTFTPLPPLHYAAAPARASAHLTQAAPRPAPDACRIDGSPATIDLAAPRDRAVQVRLAHRHGVTVALVTLGRAPAPRQIREGLVFVESRLVTFDHDRPPHAVPAPGFAPDASPTLHDDATVWVLGRERVDVHAGPDGFAVPLRLARLGLDGRVQGEMQTLDDTAGASVDSPWFEGSVVLGRASREGTRLVESLWSFEDEGSVRGAPREITRTQSDDALGRFRIGLGAGRAEGARRVAWTVADGADAGVWTREIDREGALSEALRITDRVGWGAEIAGDGAGVFYRRGGERGAPVQWWVQPWGARDAEPLGEGWDPLVSWSGSRLFAIAEGEDEDRATLSTATAECPHASPIEGLDDATRAELAGSPDLDVVGTDDGGALAVWFADPDGARRLMFARVRCGGAP